MIPMPHPRLVSRARGWAVQLALVAAVTTLVCSQSWFYADDWVMASLLPRLETRELLLRSYFGHLMPGFAVAQRAFWTTAGSSWATATLITVLILVAASVASRRLVEATVDRAGPWGFVAGLTVPLSLSFLLCAPWWSATMQPLVPAVAGIAVVGACTRYYRTGRRRHLVALALVDALAMSFFEKSAIYSAFAGLWCVLVVRSGGPRAVLTQVLRRWPAWLVLAAVDLPFLLVYLAGDYGDGFLPTTPGLTSRFVARSIGLGVVPAVFGIDLLRVPGPVVVPLAVLAAALLLGIWVVLIRRHRGNLAVLVFWLLCLVIAELPLAIGRSGLSGPDAGRLLRYQLDAGALALLTLTVAAARARVEETRHRAGRAALAGVIGLLVCATSVSAWATIGDYPAGEARAWHDAFVSTWPRDGQVRVVDGPLNAPLAPSWMFPFSSRRTVLDQVVTNVEWVDTLEGSLAIGDDGRVGPAVFTTSASFGRGSCVPTRSGDTVPVTSVPPGDYDIRVTFVTTAPTQVRLLVGDPELQPSTRPYVRTVGAGRAIELTWWSTQVPFSVVGVDVASGSVCLEKVELGRIEPR